MTRFVLPGEFKCRDETVKPGTRKYTIPLDKSKSRVEFEACLLDNGVYDIEIGLMDEEGNAVKINKVCPTKCARDRIFFEDATRNLRFWDGDSLLQITCANKRCPNWKGNWFL